MLSDGVHGYSYTESKSNIYARAANKPRYLVCTIFLAGS
jgi:hypothetical protein